MDRKATGSLPFIGAMNDGVDLMRKLWGAAGLPSASGLTQLAHGLPQALPSMITPTLDLDELDKRIADLRAVEQWLALNANMLRTTIQSLEVQRNTIATLKNFGGSMLSSMRVGASQPMAREAGMFPPTKASPVPAPAPAAAAPRPKPAAPPRARKKPGTDTAHPSMPLNPAAWWGALHEQFTKVASAAAAGMADKAAGAPPKPARPPAPARAAASADRGRPRARRSPEGTRGG